MIALLDNECSFSVGDNHRWWGHSNSTSCCSCTIIALILALVELLNEFRMKQTKMYVCTLVEFILVEIWIHCCTKLNLN